MELFFAFVGVVVMMMLFLIHVTLLEIRNKVLGKKEPKSYFGYDYDQENK